MFYLSDPMLNSWCILKGNFAPIFRPYPSKLKLIPTKKGLGLLKVLCDRYCTFKNRRIMYYSNPKSLMFKLNRIHASWNDCYGRVYKSRDSAVGIPTGYGMDDQGVGVRVPVWARIFTSPRRPDRLWGPSSLLSNVYLRHFPRGKAAGAWSWPLSN
jgi:hypothetical protein